MPTYEYRCKSCGHQFDIVQSFADDALTECPSCGEPTLKKVFGNVGITFKGSGFYKTDSRSSSSSSTSKDAGSSTKETTSASSDSSSGSSGSSDGGASSSAPAAASTSTSAKEG